MISLRRRPPGHLSRVHSHIQTCIRTSHLPRLRHPLLILGSPVKPSPHHRTNCYHSRPMRSKSCTACTSQLHRQRLVSLTLAVIPRTVIHLVQPRRRRRRLWGVVRRSSSDPGTVGEAPRPYPAQFQARPSLGVGDNRPVCCSRTKSRSNTGRVDSRLE
jgi:hypothetical protein